MGQFCIRLGIKNKSNPVLWENFVLLKFGNHIQIMWAHTNYGFYEPILTNDNKDPGSQTVYVPFSAWFFTSANTGADPFYSCPLWLHYQPDRKLPSTSVQTTWYINAQHTRSPLTLAYTPQQATSPLNNSLRAYWKGDQGPFHQSQLKFWRFLGIYQHVVSVCQTAWGFLSNILDTTRLPRLILFRPVFWKGTLN